MEKDFEKNLIVRTLNLQREFTQLRSDSVPSNILEKVREELNQLIQPLLEFIDPQHKSLNASQTTELINANLTKVYGITETIIDGYEKHYVQTGKSRVRSSFEHCEKPQLLFKDKIDNSDRPFIPKLKEKHNKLVPLDPYFVEYQKTEEIPSDFKFGHPYQHELEHLKMDYALLLKTFSKQITQVHLDSTSSFHYVDTLEEFKQLVSKLCLETNFFFDVHNHSFRSFLGFICFIEISTDNEDFLIDALKLREHLHLLNQPFTNPKILKVGMDTKEKLLWLQRDFGIYTVNLIDLGLIVNKLHLPDSLPFLSNRFLGFSFRDIYSEFDFRRRPLTPNQKLFLRSFSHLTLRLFYALKELIPKFGFDSFFEDVFEDSKKYCLRAYEKPAAEEIPPKLALDPQFNLQMNKFSKLKKLISWRDYTARLEDESREFIFPDELILSILYEMPEDVEELKNRVKSYPLEVSTNHLDTIFLLIEDNDSFQENKELSKYEVNENSSGILQSLFTPTRSLFRPMNGSALEKESPAYDQGDLHRIIRWSSGKKDMGESLETPRKLFDDFLASSAIRDSPNENLSEDLIHIRNIINNRNDTNYVKREVQKIPFLRESASKLKEIREEDPAIDSLEFSTIKENLPQNIGEIYELGNNIRKRNKNKKKKELKQTKTTSEFLNSLDFSHLSSQGGDNSQRMGYGSEKGGKNNKEDLASSDNILRDLGWI